ncbi:MAG: hypothetical protein MUO26_06575 [Methanotrichaceae archaeon]|nr:hypothetical protein [Methanotrichaceae archaeon]
MKERDSENPHTRATNDIRVRKKLQNWVNGIGDVARIINALPYGQTNKIITDDAFIDLLRVVNMMTWKKKFLSVLGDIEEPDSWEAVDLDEQTNKKVEDQDILRTILLRDQIETLCTTANLSLEIQESNPIDVALLLAPIYSNPDLRKRLRISAMEQKAIEKIIQILKKHNDERLLSRILTMERDRGIDRVNEVRRKKWKRIF